MALVEDALEGLAEGGLVTGVAVVGVLLLAPRLLPVVGRTLRPLAVGAIRTGMSIYNEAAAAVSEATGDLVAEARGVEAAPTLEAAGVPPEHARRRPRGTEAPA